jgi:transposase
MEALDITPDDWREWRRFRTLLLKQGWRQRHIAQVIQEEFGVRSHKDHVGRLLEELLR